MDGGLVSVVVIDGVSGKAGRGVGAQTLGSRGGTLTLGSPLLILLGARGGEGSPCDSRWPDDDLGSSEWRGVTALLFQVNGGREASEGIDAPTWSRSSWIR